MLSDFFLARSHVCSSEDALSVNKSASCEMGWREVASESILERKVRIRIKVERRSAADLSRVRVTLYGEWLEPFSRRAIGSIMQTMAGSLAFRHLDPYFAGCGSRLARWWSSDCTS